MANIQAALNSMLSSGVAGAFLYQQTPTYKQRAQIKALKSENETLEQESNTLNNILDTEKGDTDASANKFNAALERSEELDADIYKNQLQLFRQTGDEKYLTEALKYTPSQREAYKEARMETPTAKKIREARERREAEILRKQNEAIEARRAEEATKEFRRKFLEGTPSQYSEERRSK